MTIPTEISGTILNNATWWVSSTGNYANKLVKQSTSGTKHYYLGNALHNAGGSSAHEIYFDTFDNKWHDSGSSNPVSFRVGSVGSETPAESSLPTLESNTGFASDEVNSGDNVIIYRGSSLQQIFSFTQPSGFYSGGSSGGSSGGGPAQPVLPVIQNVVFTKTADDEVTLTFDWDENDGPLTAYNVFRVRPGDPLYNNGTGLSGTSGSENRNSSTIQLLGGLKHGDILYIENHPTYTNFVPDVPLHIVNGFGGISDPYIHKFVDYSVGTVSNVKSVIVKFFGSSPTPLPNTSPTFDGMFVNNVGDSVNWSHTGNLLTVSLPYKIGKRYRLKIRQTGSSTEVENYGYEFRAPLNKVFHNFWQ